MSSVLIGIYLGLLVLLARLKTREVKSPILQLLKVFFPSWKFFEDSGRVPELLYRIDQEDWKPAWTPPPRSWLKLAINSEVNYRLACQSLLEQVTQELEAPEWLAHPERYAESVSYLLVQNLVLHEISRVEKKPQVFSYQFKLATYLPRAGESTREELLISPEMKWN